MRALESLGRETVDTLDAFGRFWRFAGQTVRASSSAASRLRNVRLVVLQMYEIGTRSLPVMMVTGMFVGMVLAVQAVSQFKSAGMEGQLGSIINLSVLRELGPVLGAVLLSGRVGGAITAELGTMRVTEQLDALRAMGTDPVRYLVVPRFVACVLLGPILLIYTALMGIFGGYYISVYIYDVNSSLYWFHAAGAIQFFDVAIGLIKSLLFSGAIALICCYKAFYCRAGAAGVGRACTESFVVSCMMILTLDFFLNVVLDRVYTMMYGMRVLLG